MKKRTIIAMILILIGMCFLDGGANTAFAAETATLTEDGYYVQKFSANEFAGYRATDGKHTYPKLSVEHDWLFAGWFTDEACTTSVGRVTTVTTDVYAKFVDADLSYIKCQVTPDTDVTSEKTNMRVISTVDSKNYSGAGFYVTYKGNTQTCSVSTLYSRLSATDDGMTCGYSPIAFNEQGQYFSAIRLKNIGNANFDEPFYIQSYWKTLDGTTVAGMSRYVRVEDSYNQIVNVPVRVDEEKSVTEGSVSVAYDSEKFSYIGYDASVAPVFENVTVKDNSGTVTITGSSDTAVVAEGLLANIRLQLKSDAGLESVTTFAVSDESFKNSATTVTLDVSDVVFKNYPLAYGGTPDTSWYDEFCDQEEETYIINSAADLYGLAKIVNDKSGDYKDEQFVDDTIILGADVVINEGESDITGWTPKGTTQYEWIPIGYNTSYRFNGEFDGDGHSISGIYYLDDEGNDAYYGGLFGITGSDSILRNFKIENSYFESQVGWNGGDTTVGSKYALMGSVVGQMAGDMYSVYSDADLVSVNERVGGLAGLTNPGSSSGTHEMDNCWFAGKIQVTRPKEAKQFIGGIVGDLLQGTLTVSNTLNSGSVKLTCSNPSTSAIEWNVGGILGGTQNSGATIVLINCLNTGEVAVADNNTSYWGTGSIVGRVNHNASFTNVYATSESFSKRTYDYQTAGNISGSISTISETNITGHVGYATNIKNLGIYAHETNPEGKWVITENGTPELKTFSNKCIDVAWYYDNNVASTDATVTIYTPEQLYGFSAVSQDYNFSGDTVKLGADITLNSGSASLWSQGISTPERMFTPIATASESAWFKGAFDGQGHTISGLWIDGSGTNGTGLFGGANVGSIANVSLINSCIKSDTAYTGSIIGFMSGDITNVYSNAYVTSTGQETGGIVGRFGGGGSASTPKQIMSECWFDGSVEVATPYVGGLIGRMDRGYNGKEISDCLNTGNVISTVSSGTTYAGGLVGAADNALYTGRIKNSVQAGNVTISLEEAVGSVIGFIKLSTSSPNHTFTFENVYTTQTLGANDNTYICGVGNWGSIQTIIGEPMYVTKADITGENAYINTELAFYDTDKTSNVWGVIDGGTPVLKKLHAGNVMTGLDEQRLSTGWYFNNHSYVKTAATNSTTTYTISNADELYGLAKLVNDNVELFQGKTVMLAEDITLNEGEATPDGWKPAEGAAKHEWTPIGNNTEYAFAGIFDGKGHTIRGVYLDDDQTAYINSGLFGMTAYTSAIKNFRLENSYFKRTYAGAYLGSVIGLMSGGTLESVYSDAIVTANGYQMGGLVGRAEYITDTILTTESDKNVYINNCWFDGQVLATGEASYDIGGIVGVVQQGYKGKTERTSSLEGEFVITNCLNSGAITNQGTNGSSDGSAQFVGGILGRDNWCKLTITINNCFNSGIITVPETNQKAVGSILGAAQRSGCVANIANTFATKESFTTALDTSSGQCSGTVTADIVIKFAEADLTGYWGYANIRSYKEKNWCALDIYTNDTKSGTFVIKENGTPELKTFSKDWLDFGWFYNNRTESEFTISTVEEFYTLPILVNNNYNSLKGFSGKTISLEADITLNQGDATKWANGEDTVPTKSWTPIGLNSINKLFAGTFDGQEHTISGLYAASDVDYLGLFGMTKYGSSVKNLRLVNSYINQTGEGFVGSVISDCRGSVANVYSNAILRSEAEQVGGIIGRANGYDNDNAVRITQTITDCWFDGVIDLNKEGRRGGGIIGVQIQGEWTLTNCLFTGSIDSEYTGSSNAYLGGMVAEVRTPATSGNATGDSVITLNSCVSAGTIKTTASVADRGVGALVGVMQASISMDEDGTFNELLQTKMIRENVFATRETAARDVYGFVSETSGDYTAEATLEGDEVIWVHNADRLVGYCSEDTITGTYEGGKLDFNSAWILRDKGTPVPAAFEEMVTKVDASTLDTALGLDKWNASLSSAIHQGVGRYILRFGSATEKSCDTYAAYVEHLLKSEADGGPGFTQYADTTSGDTGTKVYSGIYTKEQGDWVLNVVCSENSGITTITIHTGIKETLSPNLNQDAVAQATGETQDMSITMMQLTGTYQDNSVGWGDLSYGESYYYGNSFVIQLPEKGHFIINDGGNVGDYDGLIAYLKAQAGTQVAEDGTVENPVYIDAWTVSHQHADHFSAVEGFVSNPADVNAVFVEAFYINEPNNRALYHVDGSLEGALEAQYRGVRICRTSDGEKTPVYWYQTGERYYFSGITMDVIQSQEQISVSSYGKRNAGDDEGTDFNTASGILLFTTANNKKILIGGDGNYVNMKCIMDMYGTNEGYTASPLLQNINVFTAWHHGKNTSYNISSCDNTFTDYLAKNSQFDVVLYPCSLVYGGSADWANAFPAAETANTYLNLMTEQYHHYGDGNVTITLE